MGKTIAEELRILRKKKNLSQQQVADMLGVPNKSTVGSWEIGKGSPDPSTLIKLCYIYGVGFEHFAKECDIDIVPYGTNRESIKFDGLSKKKQEFMEEAISLDDDDLQLILDIFRSVRNRREGRQG